MAGPNGSISQERISLDRILLVPWRADASGELAPLRYLVHTPHARAAYKYVRLMQLHREVVEKQQDPDTRQLGEELLQRVDNDLHSKTGYSSYARLEHESTKKKFGEDAANELRHSPENFRKKIEEFSKAANGDPTTAVPLQVIQHRDTMGEIWYEIADGAHCAAYMLAAHKLLGPRFSELPLAVIVKCVCTGGSTVGWCKCWLLRMEDPPQQQSLDNFEVALQLVIDQIFQGYPK